MRKQLHGISVTELRSPDGATAVVADHGAHVLSWVPARGSEALFLSEASHYGDDAAIRGGVPVIFPQFADGGPGRKHGFARVSQWRLVFSGIENDRAVARFELTQQDLAGDDWLHPFGLNYEVSVHGQQLTMSLSVHNQSDQAWQFTAALHTYLRVQDVDAVAVRGLRDVHYIDKVLGAADAVQLEEPLRITGNIDRIYLDAPDALAVEDGARDVSVRQQGFSDTVVWNPGREKSAALPDMARNEYRSFVCIEAAAVGQPLVLAAGARWQGAQTLAIDANRR